MFYKAKFDMFSYKPLQLEGGMLFNSKRMANIFNEDYYIFELNKVPEDEEKFLLENGYPLEPRIINIYTNEIMAQPHQIGWIDEGDDVDELREMDVEDINYILNSGREVKILS